MKKTFRFIFTVGYIPHIEYYVSRNLVGAVFKFYMAHKRDNIISSITITDITKELGGK